VWLDSGKKKNSVKEKHLLDAMGEGAGGCPMIMKKLGLGRSFWAAGRIHWPSWSVVEEPSLAEWEDPRGGWGGYATLAGSFGL